MKVINIPEFLQKINSFVFSTSNSEFFGIVNRLYNIHLNLNVEKNKTTDSKEFILLMAKSIEIVNYIHFNERKNANEVK